MQLSRSFPPRVILSFSVTVVKPIWFSCWSCGFMTAQNVMTIAMSVPEFPPCKILI